MKRMTPTLLLLVPIALAGCQTLKAHSPFRHKEPAYTSAQQEQPLEVPPGLDQPSTTEALTIPNAGTGTASATTTLTVPPETGAPPATEPTTVAPSGATDNNLALPDTPANTYQRVGLALARGDVGQMTGHDDNALTYRVAVDTTQESQGGFFHRFFHHRHNDTAKGSVTVSVTPSGTGSMVSAQGNPDAVARIMGMLRQRLE